MGAESHHERKDGNCYDLKCLQPFVEGTTIKPSGEYALEPWSPGEELLTKLFSRFTPVSKKRQAPRTKTERESQGLAEEIKYVGIIL